MAPSPRSRLAVAVAYLLTLAAPSSFAQSSCGSDAPSLAAAMMAGYGAAPRKAALERLQAAPGGSCAGLVRGFLEEYQKAVDDWKGKPDGTAELVTDFNRVADALGGGVDDYRADYFGGFGRPSHAAVPKTLDQGRLEARFTRREQELKAAFAATADQGVMAAAATRRDTSFQPTTRASILQRLSSLKTVVPPLAQGDAAQSPSSAGRSISGTYHKLGLGAIAGGVVLGGLLVLGAVPATLAAGVAVVVLIAGGAVVYMAGKPAGSMLGRVGDVFQGR